MENEKPKILHDRLYRLLREGAVAEFNRRRAGGEECDLRGADFRSLDLRGADLRALDLSGCYFRQADLRGLDLSSCCLEGASIHNANISGVYFPKELESDEIRLSLAQGTRMRYRS
jgi:uncharacterized protein YjbI with pentapeptide repeats